MSKISDSRSNSVHYFEKQACTQQKKQWRVDGGLFWWQVNVLLFRTPQKEFSSRSALPLPFATPFHCLNHGCLCPGHTNNFLLIVYSFITTQSFWSSFFLLFFYFFLPAFIFSFSPLSICLSLISSEVCFISIIFGPWMTIRPLDDHQAPGFMTFSSVGM